ncbi:MAG: hypothetical protein ACJ8GN_15575 [Longimicrobiaceae bacterium]
MSGATHHPKGVRALMAAALAACAASPLAAQARPAARVGDQVQVSSPALPGIVRGELVLVRNDSLYVRPGASRSVAVSLAQVDWIVVRRRRHVLEGMALGAGIGAPIGAGSGYLLGALADSGGCADECGFVPTVLAAAGALAGTVLGAIIGGAAPGGRWVPAARPGGGGVALTVGLSLPTR